MEWCRTFELVAMASSLLKSGRCGILSKRKGRSPSKKALDETGAARAIQSPHGFDESEEEFGTPSAVVIPSIVWAVAAAFAPSCQLCQKGCDRLLWQSNGHAATVCATCFTAHLPSSTRSVAPSGPTLLSPAQLGLLSGVGREMVRLDLRGIKIKSFPSGALCKLPDLTSVTIAHLSELTTLGEDFLYHCPKLSRVTIMNLPLLTQLDDRFANNCSKLRIATFEQLPLLSAIGDAFFAGSFGGNNKITLDLGGLAALKEIGHYFLRACGATGLVLTLPQSVETIGNHCLEACRYLAEMAIYGGVHVTDLGHSFLRCCGPLSTLNIACFSNLAHIGSYFLAEGKMSILALNGTSSVVSIGGSFLEACADLRSVTLDGFWRLQTVGPGFLAGTPVETVDLSKLLAIAVIGPRFLNKSHASRVDIVGSPSLSSIGNDCLAESSGLRKVTLRADMLQTVGPHFASNCSKLMHLDLSGCPNIITFPLGEHQIKKDKMSVFRPPPPRSV